MLLITLYGVSIYHVFSIFLKLNLLSEYRMSMIAILLHCTWYNRAQKSNMKQDKKEKIRFQKQISSAVSSLV